MSTTQDRREQIASAIAHYTYVAGQYGTVAGLYEAAEAILALPDIAQPDLLEALKRLRTECDLSGLRDRAGFDCWLGLADEAIAKAEALAQSPPDGWMPIETASKDGTEVLAYWQYPTFQSYDVAHFNGGAGQWFLAGDEAIPPTHWQPLPAAPKAQP